MNCVVTLAFLSCTAISALLADDLEITKIRLDETELRTCEYVYTTYFNCYRLKVGLENRECQQAIGSALRMILNKSET